MHEDNLPQGPYLPSIKDLGHTPVGVPAITIKEWVRSFLTLKLAAYADLGDLPEVRLLIGGCHWFFTEVVVDGWYLIEEATLENPPLQYLLLPGIAIRSHLEKTKGLIPYVAYAAIDPMHSSSDRMRRGLEIYTATLLQQQIPD